MSQEGVLSFNSSGAAVVETLTGNSGGAVGPDAGHNINITGNTTLGITVIGNPGTNSLNIVASQATTTQFGVVKLATNAQAIAGTDTAAALTSDDLKAKLGTQTLHGLPIGASTSGAITWTAAPSDGQLLIGRTGLDPVLGTLTAGTGISISNGAGAITITNTGGASFAYTLVNTTPYIVLPADQYLGVDSSGGIITVQFPNAPATGKIYVVKDKTGSATTNNITVTTVGGVVTIDGATTYVMNTNYQAIELIFNGTSYEVF